MNRMLKRICVETTLFFVLAAVPALGEMYWHQSSGPGGGTTNCLAVDARSGVIYAGTSDGGVFKSSNSGSSWTASSGGLPNEAISALAIDSSGNIYCGVGSGVWKSTDGGNTWAFASTGLPEYSNALCFAIDPTSDTVYVGTGNSIYKSADGGNSWSMVNNGYPDYTSARALAINPANSNIVYVGTFDHGVYRSTDGGSSWSDFSNGLPAQTTVQSLVLDPEVPQTVYVGTNIGEVYQYSAARGGWWRLRDGLTPATLAIDGSGRTIYAAGYWGGVVRSSDGGTSWTDATADLTGLEVRALALDPGSASTVYAATNLDGVFKSTSSGASWSRNNQGLAATRVFTLTTDPGDSRTIYAGTYANGVSRSTDGGTTWTRKNTGFTSNETVYSLAIGPSASPAMYAATGTGIYKSVNAAESWLAVGQRSEIQSVAIDPTNSQIVYAGGYGAVFKSTDGGESWLRLQQGLPLSQQISGLTIDPGGQILYAGSRSGVSRSADGGATWNYVNNGLPTTVVQALTLSPADSATIYAALGSGGIFKSSDRGGSWTPLNSGLTDLLTYSVAVDPTTPATLYAGTSKGVFRSTDGGLSWSEFNNGVQPDRPVKQLLVDPADSQVIYAGTEGKGVFTTGGDRPTISGTPDTSVTAGQRYSFTPRASNAISFSISGKPRWANFDERTGSLTGWVGNADAGTYGNIVITASDNASGSAALPAFTITVNRDVTAPSVTTFALASSKTFTVGMTVVAEDETGVTGYLVKPFYTSWPASDPAWSATLPTSYTFTSSGSKTLYVWARDGAGNVSAHKSATVTVDSTKPVVSYFKIKSAVNSGTIPVTAFSATDNTGVTGYLITESSVEPDAAGEWQKSPPTSYSTTSPPGVVMLYAWARDAAGNISSPLSAKTTLDKTPPVITQFTAPTAHKSLVVPVVVSANDDCKLSGYLITLTGETPTAGTWTLAPPTSFTVPTPGTKTLYAWAKDEAGNVSVSAAATVIVDTTAPTISEFSLRGPSGRLSVPLTLTATDNTGVTGYQITTFATAPLASGTGWSVGAPQKHIFTTPGIKTLYAWAKDAAGNVSAYKSATVNIDMTAPVVLSFGVKSATNSNSVPVTAFSASDNTSVTGYLITESSIPPPFDAVWQPAASKSYDTASSGLITLYAWARDAAGNVSVAKPATTTIDKTAPTISTFSAPAQTRSLGIPIKLTASDNVSVTGYLVTTSATVPAGAIWRGTPPTSYGFTSAGIKTLYAFVRDAAGNVSNPATATVNIDTTPPSVTSFSLGTATRELTVPVTLTATDLTGVTGYQITTSAFAPLASAAGWRVAPPATYTFTSSGRKTLYAWAKDGAGNVSAYRSATVIIDSTPPAVISFMVPPDSKSQSFKVIALSASDNTAVNGYLITESSTPPAPDDPGWQTKAPTGYSTVNTGPILLYAWAKDAAGNVSPAKQASTVVDLVAPKLTVSAPAISKASIPITISAADNIKVTGYYVTLSSAAPTVYTVWSATPPATIVSSTPGPRTIYAYARDAAGNVSSAASTAVTVDNTAPSITIFTLTPQSHSLTVAVGLTAYDGTGVTGYQITTSAFVAPAATGGGWSAGAPTSYTFPSAGTKTLYAWVKDGAGNVSYSRAATVRISP